MRKRFDQKIKKQFSNVISEFRNQQQIKTFPFSLPSPPAISTQVVGVCVWAKSFQSPIHLKLEKKKEKVNLSLFDFSIYSRNRYNSVDVAKVGTNDS